MSNNDRINEIIRRAAGIQPEPEPEPQPGQPPTAHVGTVYAGAGTGAPPVAHMTESQIMNRLIRWAGGWQ